MSGLAVNSAWQKKRFLYVSILGFTETISTLFSNTKYKLLILFLFCHQLSADVCLCCVGKKKILLFKKKKSYTALGLILGSES